MTRSATSSAGSSAIAWGYASHNRRSASSGCAASNVVYAYEEKFSAAKIICKFLRPEIRSDRDKAAWMARQEYEGLKTLRGYNLVGSPHHVVRPLGFQSRHQRRAGCRILFRRGIQPGRSGVLRSSRTTRTSIGG